MFHNSHPEVVSVYIRPYASAEFMYESLIGYFAALYQLYTLFRERTNDIKSRINLFDRQEQYHRLNYLSVRFCH